MRKRKLGVKPNHLLTFATLLLIIIGYACRKHFTNNDSFNYTKLYNTFFDVSGVSNPTVLDIVANIKQQETRMHFAQSFVQQDGYIQWHNALVVDKEGQDIALLPFVKQGASEITGYIQAQKLDNNKGYTYEFFRTRNLSNYNYNNTSSRLNGKLANNIINYFNYSLFGKTNATIPHKNVLPTYLQDQLGNGINLVNIKRNVISEQAYNTYNNNIKASSMRIEPVCNGRYVYYVYVNLAFEVMGIEKVCIAQEVVSVISTGNEPSNGGGGSNNIPYWWLYGNNTGSGSGQGSIGGDPGVGGGGSGGTPGNSNCVYIPVGANNNMQQPVTTIEPVNYYGGDPGGWQQCGGGNVQPLLIIAYDSTFVNSKSKCTLDSLRLRSSFVNSLLNTFDGIDGNRLTFKLADTSQIYALGGNYYDHAVTSFGNNDTSFIIGVAYVTDSASNLFRMITLAHELIHARMFYSLRKAGFLKINTYGNIELDTTGVNTFVNLNSVSSENERFRILVKTYMNNIPPGDTTMSPYNWTHELFNTATFDIETYRKKLEQMILEAGKLNLQNPDFIASCTNPILAISLFGFNLTTPNTWQSQFALYTSYAGLQNTPGFNSFLTNQRIDEVRYNSFLQIFKFKPNKNCE